MVSAHLLSVMDCVNHRFDEGLVGRMLKRLWDVEDRIPDLGVLCGPALLLALSKGIWENQYDVSIHALILDVHEEVGGGVAGILD